jgi:hypothetical protein
LFGSALFNEPQLAGSPDGMVLVRDISFAALSSTNLLPFHGHCHIAYIPKRGVILGLSKLARVARCLASRVQSQQQFADDLMEAVATYVRPSGVAVVVEAWLLSEPNVGRNGRTCSPPGHDRFAVVRDGEPRSHSFRPITIFGGLCSSFATGINVDGNAKSNRGHRKQHCRVHAHQGKLFKLWFIVAWLCDVEGVGIVM